MCWDSAYRCSETRQRKGKSLLGSIVRSTRQGVDRSDRCCTVSWQVRTLIG